MIKMLYLLSVITFSLCQDIPFIESIEPSFGGLGSTIIITGSDFSPNDVDNTVFFGGLEANILNATENELMVTVPYGTYYTPISVYTNGLYASSSQRFNVIFDAAEELTVSHISNQLDNPYLGAKYYDIKIADMNGDEIPEIVTSEAGSGSSAYLAIFTTSFDEEGMISIDDRLEINFGTGVYSVPHDIALGDLNGDGLLDIVTSEKGDVTDDFEAHTCIFINTSHHQNFSFDDPIIIPGDGYEMYAQVQDINGDGKLDIVTSRQSWGQMGVYLNTTEQNVVSFANKVIPEVDVEPRPVFADLNGDGIINMVSVANTNNRRDVYIYSNNSTENTINFNLELIVQSGGVHPPGPTDYDWCNTAPTLADIDGDGKLDIIIANGAASFTSPSGISVLRNISTPDVLAFEYDFLNYYQYTSNSLPSRISISDLNGDGKPDILTTDWLGGISIMVNSSTEGSIVLEEQMIIGIGNYPLSIATADLNMDSTPEIVVANWEVEGMRVIHNFLPVNDSGGGDVYGCTDPEATNYNPEATVDDGSCCIELWGVCYNIEETTDLNLSHNQLIGEIPSAIGQLTNLIYLDLSYNQITNLPESIENLSNLTGLLLYSNNLTSIPESICNLPSDCFIVIHDNLLCEEYHYDCIDEWGIQDHWNCCEGENGEPSWTECDPCDLGDVNCDGEVNVLDIVIAANIILVNEYDELADINGDGLLNILDLVTLVNWVLYDSTCMDIDGNVYPTIWIGSQLWMAENLKTTHYNNGDEIPTGLYNDTWENATEGAYSIFWDDPINADVYGNLYNWYTVDDDRGICPEGFHVPFDGEFMELELFLGISEQEVNNTGWRGTLEGGWMKEEGTEHWNEPNLGATNYSGFTALPAGERSYSGSYHLMKSYSWFWSSTEGSSNDATIRSLRYYDTRVSREFYPKFFGLSIRCLKD